MVIYILNDLNFKIVCVKLIKKQCVLIKIRFTINESLDNPTAWYLLPVPNKC